MAITPARAATPVRTVALAASTMIRRGTAANVTLIIPVPYSSLMLSTASAHGSRGLVIEMTDGTAAANAGFRRNVGFYYDLVKANVERIVTGLSAELEDHPVTAVGVTPGWLRSEKMLENFGVTEDTWREACAKTPGFAISESPAYIGRGVAALATAAAADSRQLAASRSMALCGYPGR